ncbi:MAG: LPS export ABC transporter ATP-binding protein, partial [Gammaproteobacteria bacterium]
VKGVSLSVRGGEVIGLLGPNGAGKTTSFYMIVGLVASEGGSIRLDDQDLTHLPMDVRARKGLGYLPQEASVFRKLTVAQNILGVLEILPGLNAHQRQRRLDALLHEFHIEHIRDNLGMSLSGGERRRVEIARALATEPRFILLDEPFAGVDPISVGDIQRIIRHLKQIGIGVLITDHNVQETLRICDRAYIVNEGTIIAEGDAETILRDEKVRQVYLGDTFTL